VVDAKYTDLLITDSNLVLDAGGQPLLVRDRACIAQDILHMILESGLLVELIGERDIRKRKTNIVKLTLMVDLDYRIRPGTSRIEEHWRSRSGVEYWLTAETLEFGVISMQLTQGATANG